MTRLLPLQTLLNVIFWLSTLLALFQQVQAEQLSFSKEEIGQGYQFNYQWLDHEKNRQSMSFVLDKEALFERFRNFKAFQKSYANKAIIRRIKKHFRKQPIEGVILQYQIKGNDVSIKATSSDDEKVRKAYQEIIKAQEEITQQYYQDVYYHPFINHDQIAGIKVDHGLVANDSVLDLKPLKPIILDAISIKNIRKATDYVLGFVQNIPYSPLESRITSSGSGFNTPARLLWENQGDCDSKMALTAGILRALMPRIKMALIYIDGHAFIGINIPAKPGEITIMHEQVSYLLAEPTGPALLPLGQIAPESELAINQGHYIAQNFHTIPGVHDLDLDDTPWVE